MNIVSILFDILEEGKKTFTMHSYMPCHMVFDVKMDFTSKSCYIATGYYAPKYDESRYARVVSRDIVHRSFTYAALNRIGIMEADIHNHYLTSLCSENYWTRCGPEF